MNSVTTALPGTGTSSAAGGGGGGSAATRGPDATVSPTNVTLTAAGPPSWELLTIAVVLCLLIAVTVIGNTLIIAAVLTTRRLRTVTNCFVMSLAVADWLLGLFVMPPKVMLHLVGNWELGSILCNIWISLDVLLCTASILSLCAISVDRYLAVTQPLNYSRRRRSKRLALLMILIVWVLALAITCPPLFLFNTKSKNEKECRYEDNRGYVIFSAMGSFYVPLTVMLYVYARISCVIARRHSQLTTLDREGQRSNHLVGNHDESDVDHGSSECEENHVGAGRCASVVSPSVLDYNSTGSHGRPLRGHSYSYCPTAPCPAPGEPPPPQPMQPSPLPAANAAAKANAHTPKRCSFYGRSKWSVGSRPESLSLDVAAVDAGYCAAGGLNLEASSRVSSFRRESKTAQTLSIVVGGFVACWLPFFISYILSPFVRIDTLIFDILIWLGWINSAINPFIYAFYSPDFRIAFWRLTFRHCSAQRRPTDPSIRHK